jgi:DNA-binding CsgD family transcriptional regulator/tetratricopeptide (TPR) repeat protein
VGERTRADLATAPLGVRRPGFVGRDRELVSLIDTLSGAEPAVVLVEGEAGVGKSRLVHEFLASANPGDVLTSACLPLGQPFTLGPVVDALRSAGDDVAQLRLSGLAGALRPMFPEWAAHLPADPEPLADARAARHRLFRALAELIDALETKVLVVEDLHWADEATLEFLVFLAARQAHRAAHLLLTFRSGEVPSGSLVHRVPSCAPANARKLRIALEPLDVPSTEQLMASMLHDQPVSKAFARAVHDRTAGLPLAVEESVRLLHDRAELVHADGGWGGRSVEGVRVPATIRDSVQERVRRLSAPAQRFLQAAAVFGDPAGVAELAKVGDLDADEAARGFAEGVDCALLRQDGRAQAMFRHGLIAAAVRELVPPLARLEMHRRAVSVLETATAPPLALLVRHCRASKDSSRWGHYAERAANLAVSAGDAATAITLLNDVIAQAELPPDDRARLAETLAVAALSRKAFFVDLVEQTARTLRVVVDAPDLTPAQRARIRNPFGRLLMQMGDYETGRSELEAAIPYLDGVPLEAARVMIYLGWPRGASWPAARHLGWLRRAERVTPRSLPEPARTNVIVHRATALLLLGEEAGWAVAREIDANVTGQARLAASASGYLNTGHAALLWGRYRDARDRLRTARQLAARIGDERVLHDIALTQAHLDWLSGSWDGLADRVSTLIDRDADPLNQLEGMLVAGLLAVAAGHDRVAYESLSLLVKETWRRGVLDQLAEPAAALARLLIRQGRVQDAVEITDQPVSLIAHKRIWIWGAEIVPVRVEALLAVGGSDDARRLVDTFARGLRGRPAPGPAAAVPHSRALLAEARGDLSLAARLFDRAASAWQALPRPYDALLARERQARCLLAVGRPDQAREVFAATRDGLAQLGARVDERRAATQLGADETDVGAVRRGRRGYGDQLSPRELEVIHLVVAGRTNREIAGALNRSPKTVATQLNSAMRKLKVSTRTALAVSALDAGLVIRDQLTSG